ncbi:MAG: hypothetical protein Q7S23_04210 [bacterium]|nr:hypothetical protein [bacterium]
MDSVVSWFAFAAFVAYAFSRFTLPLAGVCGLLGLGLLFALPTSGCVLICAGVLLGGLCQIGRVIFKDLE